MPTHKINADLALTGTLTVGVDDTGHDVIFYGATSGKYLHWDESADALKFRDSTYLYLGAGNDLQLYHNGTNNFIETYAGTLFITQHANDSDIILRSDDGSGGVTAYLTLDGGAGFTIADKKIRYKDNVEAAFGSSDDMMLKHDGTDGFIQNYTGDLYIRNNTNDKDIILQSDDGSGGTTTYLRIDGGDEIMKAGKNLRFNDNVKGTFGTSDDLQIYHDGTNSYIHNNTGTLRIEADQDDGDIEFRADDNSGGLETYMFLDGGNNNIKFQKDTNFIDNVEAVFGTGSDLKIKHDGTDSLIRNFTGNLIFRQTVDDGNITFQNDDGSGGNATYLTIDGNNELVQASKNFKVGDNLNIFAGTGNDLQIIHDGSDSYIKTGNSSTGNLIIEQNLADKDIILKSDNGSGGTTAYITLDGSTSKVIIDQTLDIQDLDIGGTATGDGSGLTDVNAQTVTITANNSTNETIFPVFVDGATGTQGLETDTGFTYNPSSGVLTASKLTTDQAAIVENAKDGAALMTLTGAGAGSEANVSLKMAGTVHGNPIKVKMTAENTSGSAVGAGILSYDPDADTFNIGQSTTHNRMGISIANTNTIGSSDVIYQEDVTIKSRVINMTANANHFEFNGDIMKIGDDATTRGKLYNYKNGTWTLADKDTEANADGLLAIAVGDNSTNDGMLLRGTITLDYDPGGAGDVLYVGDDGVIQNSAPSGSGDIVRIVGYLLGGAHGNIFFDPDKTFVEVA